MAKDKLAKLKAEEALKDEPADGVFVGDVLCPGLVEAAKSAEKAAKTEAVRAGNATAKQAERPQNYPSKEELP